MVPEFKTLTSHPSLSLVELHHCTRMTPSLDEETVKKVIRQVEFYFSDSNLPRDGFLRKSIEESEDGMVSLALICSFSRMRSHLGLEADVKPEDVTEDTLKAVAETLRTSSVLKISEDGTRIGRTTALLKPEEVIEQLDARTIAASPLEHDITREAVELFFNQHAKVTSVRLPRHVADKRFFCGTALIEFSTEEEAASLLKQSLTYAGAELELKPKKEFDAEREILVMELERSRSSKGSANKSSPADADYPKGLIVAFKLKHKSAGASADTIGVNETTDNGGAVSPKVAPEESKQEASENVKEGEVEPIDNVEQKNGETAVDKSSGKVKESTEGADDEEKSPEGADDESEKKAAHGEKSSYETNKEDKDIVLREDLKELFQKFGIVKYVDFSMGQDSGFIRFEEPEAAQKARAAAILVETGLEVKNFFATLEPVTGEAEREYWNKFRGSQDRLRDGKGNRGRGGRNYRGGKFDNRRRSRDHDSHGGRPNKAQKV